MKQYTIKPLVWEMITGVYYAAHTPFGVYVVELRRSGWQVVVPHSSGWNYTSDRHGDSEAAKLAAEKWYVEQLEQALTEVTE